MKKTFFTTYVLVLLLTIVCTPVFTQVCTDYCMYDPLPPEICGSARWCDVCTCDRDETAYWAGPGTPRSYWEVHCGVGAPAITIAPYTDGFGPVEYYPNNTLGTPDAMYWNGYYYLVYGYHNWTEDRDKMYMATSTNGRTFFGDRMIMDTLNPRIFEAWGPTIIKGPNPNQIYVYVTAHINQPDPLAIYLMISNDGGATFSWYPANTNPQPVVGPSNAWQDVMVINGQYIMYYTNWDSGAGRMYRRTSADGISWGPAEGPTNLPANFGIARIAYYQPGNFYIATGGYGSQGTIQTMFSCTHPSTYFPELVLSQDGLFFDNSEQLLAGLENYLYVTIPRPFATQAAITTNEYGILTTNIPFVYYMDGVANPASIWGTQLIITGP